MSEDTNKLMPKDTSTSSADDGDNENGNKSAVGTDIVHISTNNSLSPYTITLYVLRIADINEKWSIQAIFENDTKFYFKAIGSLKNLKVNLLDLIVNVENDIHLE